MIRHRFVASDATCWRLVGTIEEWAPGLMVAEDKRTAEQVVGGEIARTAWLFLTLISPLHAPRGPAACSCRQQKICVYIFKGREFLTAARNMQMFAMSRMFL